MSKTIEISLTQSSIRDAIRELENYKREINFKLEEFIRRLAEEGVVVAKQQIMAFPAVDSGELLNSIEFEKGDVISDGVTYYVYTGCDYAGFVEFGTGIVGGTNPHPNPQAVSGTLSSGARKTYSSYSSQGWIYPKDGKFYYTEGQPAKPFMYNTAMDLYTKVHKIAKEVFG